MAEGARAPTQGPGGLHAALTRSPRAAPEVGRGRARRAPPGPRPPAGASPPHWPARTAAPTARNWGVRPGRRGARPEQTPGRRVYNVTL